MGGWLDVGGWVGGWLDVGICYLLFYIYVFTVLVLLCVCCIKPLSFYSRTLLSFSKTTWLWLNFFLPDMLQPWSYSMNGLLGKKSRRNNEYSC